MHPTRSASLLVGAVVAATAGHSLAQGPGQRAAPADRWNVPASPAATPASEGAPRPAHLPPTPARAPTDRPVNAEVIDARQSLLALNAEVARFAQRLVEHRHDVVRIGNLVAATAAIDDWPTPLEDLGQAAVDILTLGQGRRAGVQVGAQISVTFMATQGPPASIHWPTSSACQFRLRGRDHDCPLRPP